jgi:uncharacterized protein
MRRLLPLLVDSLAPGMSRADTDEAAFSAGFGHDEQGRVVIRVAVDAMLPLLCQRSLKPYGEPARRRSVLVVIEDLAEESLLTDSEEAVLVEDGRLDLLRLVEDELLLAVPQVPKDPAMEAIELSTGGVVVTPSLEEKQDRQAGQGRKPFAGLADMLKDKG